MEADFSIRWTPAPPSFRVSGKYNVVPITDAGNQQIFAKSVRKRSTETEHVKVTYGNVVILEMSGSQITAKSPDFLV